MPNANQITVSDELQWMDSPHTCVEGDEFSTGDDFYVHLLGPNPISLYIVEPETGVGYSGCMLIDESTETDVVPVEELIVRLRQGVEAWDKLPNTETITNNSLSALANTLEHELRTR